MARATSHQFRALVGVLLLDPVLVDADARILADLAARHRLHMHQGWAALMRAWAQTRSGAHADSIAAYERGLNAIAATGSQIWMPFLMSGLAEALAASGAMADAHRMIEQAIVTAAETGEGSCEPELWRIRGELFVNGTRRDRSEAARSMEHALERARAQQARLWELRAATSLARLWADQGERNKAVDLLAPIHAGFTEGFGTTDLRQAQALLEELRSSRPQTVK
jgi:predicted ATPase